MTKGRDREKGTLANFPRPLLIGAITHVQLKKLSWDWFPEASAKLINRPDSPDSATSFLNMRLTHQLSGPPALLGHPQSEALCPLLQGPGI